MDAARFDALVRSLDFHAPRRAALGAIGAGLAALLAIGGDEDAEAKKKKCKGKKKKCGKKCIPKSKCCKSSECGPDQTCQNGRCTCPGEFFACGDTCVTGGECCVASDCGPIYECADGFCLCLESDDIPCLPEECCQAGEVCAITEESVTCQDGGCPTTDICSDPDVFLCGASCYCATSVEDQTACIDFLVSSCFECTTDAECTTDLGQDAICIPTGEFCTGCDGFTNVCIATGCPSTEALRNGNARASGLQREGVKRIR